jgi:GntR family transcriptional regulator/MocR family aminotransferase
LIQKALGQFIKAGHYAAHIRRMRLLYAKRRAFLVELIESHLGKTALSEFNSNAGLHLILNLPNNSNDVAISEAANAKGVLVRPLSRYYMLDNARQGLLMGFACVPEEQMAKAFTLLLDCIRKQQA